MSRILSLIEQVEPGVVILNEDLTVSSVNSMVFMIFGHIPRERIFAETSSASTARGRGKK